MGYRQDMKLKRKKQQRALPKNKKTKMIVNTRETPGFWWATQTANTVRNQRSGWKWDRAGIWLHITISWGHAADGKACHKCLENNFRKKKKSKKSEVTWLDLQNQLRDIAHLERRLPTRLILLARAHFFEAQNKRFKSLWGTLEEFFRM